MGRIERGPELGDTGKVRAWARIEETLGWEVTIVRHRPRPRGKWVSYSPTAPRPHGPTGGDLSEGTTVSFTYERLPAPRTGFRGVLPRR